MPRKNARPKARKELAEKRHKLAEMNRRKSRGNPKPWGNVGFIAHGGRSSGSGLALLAAALLRDDPDWNV